MSDIFRDVDEALKQEKLEAFWQKNGNLVLFLIALLIIGTAISSAYSYYKVTKTQKQTAELLTLRELPTEKMSVPASLNGDPVALARMTIAAKQLSDNQPAQAFHEYKAITELANIAPELKALAAYYAKQIALDPALDLNATDIIYPSGTIWQPYLDFTEAVRLVIQEQNYDSALTLLDNIVENGEVLPQSFRVRAYQLREIYQYDRPALTNDSTTAVSSEETKE